MKEIKLILGCLLVSIQAIGCDCILVPMESQIKDSEYVLRVKVVRLLDTKRERIDYHFPDTNDNRSYRAHVGIMTVYKGTVKEKSIDMSTEYTNCEPYYKLDGEYLLFVRKVDEKYFVIHCTYSTELDRSTRRILRKIERLTKK
jgi:hypothetical protein